MKTENETGLNALNASRDRLSKDVVAIAGDASDLLKNVASQKLDSAKQALTQAQTAVTSEARQFAGSADGFVQMHPWKAVGAAGAIGMVLGMLLARR